MRFEREDAYLEQIALGVLEQRGIFHTTDDIRVNLARLVGRQEFGLGELAVHVHAEVLDRGALGHGEKKGAFATARVGIVEHLFHGCASDLVLNFHIHLLRPQFQRGKDRVRAGRYRARRYGMRQDTDIMAND